MIRVKKIFQTVIITAFIYGLLLDPFRPCMAGDIGSDTALYKEGRSLDVKFKRLSTLCLNKDGNLLAGDLQARYPELYKKILLIL